MRLNPGFSATPMSRGIEVQTLSKQVDISSLGDDVNSQCLSTIGPKRAKYLYDGPTPV